MDSLISQIYVRRARERIENRRGSRKVFMLFPTYFLNVVACDSSAVKILILMEKNLLSYRLATSFAEIGTFNNTQKIVAIRSQLRCVDFAKNHDYSHKKQSLTACLDSNM